jgi:hypothetical protein
MSVSTRSAARSRRSSRSRRLLRSGLVSPAVHARAADCIRCPATRRRRDGGLPLRIARVFPSPPGRAIAQRSEIARQRRRYRATASVRFFTPSLRRMFLTCVWTVLLGDVEEVSDLSLFASSRPEPPSTPRGSDNRHRHESRTRHIARHAVSTPTIQSRAARIPTATIAATHAGRRPQQRATTALGITSSNRGAAAGPSS